MKGIPDRLTDLAAHFDILVNLLKSANTDDTIKDKLSGLVSSVDFLIYIRTPRTDPYSTSTFEEKAKVIAAKLERSTAARVIETTVDQAFIARELNAIAFAIDIVMVRTQYGITVQVSELAQTSQRWMSI